MSRRDSIRVINETMRVDVDPAWLCVHSFEDRGSGQPLCGRDHRLCKVSCCEPCPGFSVDEREYGARMGRRFRMAGRRSLK